MPSARRRRRRFRSQIPVSPIGLNDALPAVAMLIAVGAIVFAAQLYWVWRFTADDAFVTFRYAANWVAGYGPNFNPGSRSEGVTSFGYLLVTTIVTAVGANPVWFAKAFGIACALATAELLAGLTLELDRRVRPAITQTPDSAPLSGRAQLAGAFAVAAWLGCFPTAIHAVAGRETLLGCALLTGFVSAILGAQRRAQAPGLGLGAVALALGLVRPELNLVAAAAWLAGAAGAFPGQRRAWLRSALLGWWIPGALYFAARALYYGHLFPISFYAIGGYDLVPGAGEVLDLFRLLLGGLGLAVSIALIIAPRETLPVAGLAVSALLVALLPGSLTDSDYRYAMPALPLVFALAGVGSAQLIEWVFRAIRGDRPPDHLVTALAAILVCAFAAGIWDHAAEALGDRDYDARALERTPVKLGHALAAFRDPGNDTPRVALAEAGAIPYYSGWRAIDTFGANDPAIGIDGQRNTAYVLDQDPDLVITVSTSARTFRAWWPNQLDAALYQASVERGFRRALTLAFGADRYLFVMARPDSAIERHLRGIYIKRRQSGK